MTGTTPGTDDSGPSVDDPHFDVDVTNIARIRVGVEVSKHDPEQFEGEAWVAEDTGVVYVAQDSMWVQHVGLTELFRRLR